MPEQYAAAPEAPTVKFRMRVLRARGTSISHNSESCPALRRVYKNQAGWCSSRAKHAGNCRRFRLCRDADTKKRVLRDKDAAQKVTRETRLPPGRTPQRGPPPLLRQLRLWETLSYSDQSN